MTATLTHHDVRVAGVRTHFVTAGRGAPLVMVHGAEIGASGAYAWRHNIAALASHFTVYALDRIGFGASDKPAITYTDQIMADHLAEFVDVLCLDRMAMIGNSMGAYGVARYAIDHPDRVQKMVLVGSGTIAMALDIPYTPGPGAAAMSRAVEEPTRTNAALLLQTLFEDRAEVNDEFIEDRLRWMTEPGAQHAMKSLHAHRQVLLSDPNLRQRFSLKHRFPELTIPAILIWGKRDRFAPVEVAFEVQRRLPNLRALHTMERSGHQAQHDDVHRFNQIVCDFLLESGR